MQLLPKTAHLQCNFRHYESCGISTLSLMKKHMVEGILHIFLRKRVLFSNERGSINWESFCFVILIDMFTHLLITLSGKLLHVKIKRENQLKYYFCIILSHVL